MADLDELINRFFAGDPIAGKQALHELVALGDIGEEELFSKPIQFAKTVQVRRRLLRYVASREKTIVGRLLERMEHPDRFLDAHAVAYLFAGLGLREGRNALDALYRQIAAGFEDGKPTSATLHNYSPLTDRFEAWGYAGGGAATLHNYVWDHSFAWEKLATFAFRGACATSARRTVSDLFFVAELIAHQAGEYTMEEISDQPGARISHRAIDGSEIWMRANDVFATWKRGEVADEILRTWSRHAHWRVRDLGAQILASLGFQRTVKPVVEWLRREPIETVRNSLLHTLECTRTAAGADALIEHFNSTQEGCAYVARGASNASDKSLATDALNTIAGGEDIPGAEALVSLARLGHRHTRLMGTLESHNYYFRLNAALALAYLGDESESDRLAAMKREASTPFERIYLAAAVAILGKPQGSAELYEELGVAASAPDFQNRVDPFFVHGYLKAAILDGLAAGGQQDKAALDAWRAEFEPLDPEAQPVLPDRPRAALSPTVQPLPASAPQRTEHPLRIFISYSHQDEKMRTKLGQHLAPLVDDGLIQIWHDREIEAGADWEREINKEIGEADVILLLVSAAFLDSRYCRKELMRALDQRKAGKSLPIPIILRPCDWATVFNRGDFKTQALPRDDRPVAGGRWPNQDSAFAVIVKELRVKLERLRGPIESTL